MKVKAFSLFIPRSWKNFKNHIITYLFFLMKYLARNNHCLKIRHSRCPILNITAHPEFDFSYGSLLKTTEKNY
jgi:hypothetical protein